MEWYNDLTVPNTTPNLGIKFQQAKDTEWFGKLYSSLDLKVQDQLQIDPLSTSLIPRGEKAKLQSRAMRALVNWTKESGQYTYNKIEIEGVKYVVGGDMTSDKDVREPTPEKAQFGPYFELAGHYFKMALGVPLKNDSYLSDSHRLQMRNVLIRVVLSLKRDIPPDEEEQVVWGDLCDLDSQVHQSQAKQAALKAFVAIALALSIDELETPPAVTQNPVWLQQFQTHCLQAYSIPILCHLVKYKRKSNLLQANTQ